ncbi:SseB family protein [Microbacterium sp. 179-B 1A2 NHS]|uniref:SseB family protein n=1 Tax=Microbacterium sp. 179-B 1A2 NHS TaxID=3142383 RepID=UPI00399F4965
MALFSRRSKNQPDDSANQPDEHAEVPVDADTTLSGVHEDVSAAVAAEEADRGPEEAVPHVPISVSTYGQTARPAAAQPASASTAGAPALPPVPAEAPVRTEGHAGMPDNTLLLAALAGLPETPDNAAILNVMRQALQGTLYLRVLGDARAQLKEGAPLRLAISTLGDKKFLLAYSGAAGIQAGVAVDPDTSTSILGQPTQSVLRNAIDAGYDGLIIDHAGPGRRIILPTALLTRTLEQADPEFTIKNLLSDARTDATARYVVEALLKTPVWIAAGTRSDGEGLGIAEARSADGVRYLQVFSHPLEVLALRRDDRPLPITVAQLATALASDPALSGVLVDAAGPWIRLDRAQLAPLLAFAETDAGAAE